MPRTGNNEKQHQHYCLGCGKPLPPGRRGLFHHDCLKADKRYRTSERRRREREKFQSWLRRQRCPRCGARLGEQAEEARRLLQECPCEASQGLSKPRTAPNSVRTPVQATAPMPAAFGSPAESGQ